MRNGHASRARSFLGATAVFLLALGFAQISMPGPAAAAIDPCTASPYCYTLTIAISGNGSGSIATTSDTYLPDGFIDCRRAAGITSGTCTHSYYVGANPAPLQVVLLVVAAPASEYCQGSSCLPGSFGTGVVLHTLGTPTAFNSISFALAFPVTLTVSKSGSGSGTVKSNPAGINCGTACFLAFGKGDQIVLGATAAAGSTFVGWSGACSGQGPTCLFTITATTYTDAEFEQGATPTLPLTTTPTPGPAPTVQPAASTRGQGSTTPATSTLGPNSDSPGPSSEASLLALQGVLGATGVATTSPAGPAGPGVANGSGTDTTPIAMAIGVAGVAIAFGMVFIGFELRRRRLGS